MPRIPSLFLVLLLGACKGPQPAAITLATTTSVVNSNLLAPGLWNRGARALAVDDGGVAEADRPRVVAGAGMGATLRVAVTYIQPLNCL